MGQINSRGSLTRFLGGDITLHLHLGKSRWNMKIDSAARLPFTRGPLKLDACVLHKSSDAALITERERFTRPEGCIWLKRTAAIIIIICISLPSRSRLSKKLPRLTHSVFAWRVSKQGGPCHAWVFVFVLFFMGHFHFFGRFN